MTHNMKSQKQLILEALESGREITPLDALRDYGCFRLGARIHELRGNGYEIKNIGKGGKHAKYRMEAK